SAPREPIDPDTAAGIDVVPRHQIMCRADEVEDLGVGRESPAGCVPECLAAHDAAAVLDREHDAAATREVLVHIVEVVIALHVVEAGQHLSPDPAMRENDGAAVRSLRHEQLPEGFLTVGAGELDKFGLDEEFSRERGRHLRQTRAARRAACFAYGHLWWIGPAGA